MLLYTHIYERKYNRVSNIKHWDLCIDNSTEEYEYPYYKGYITESKYFKCSLIDKEIIEDYTWRIDTSGYLATKINKKNVYMHNLLIGDLLVDHKNNNRTDNRRCNLRKCTSQENNRNRSRAKNNNSGFIGVSWKENLSKWRAYIMIDNKQKHLGVFESKTEAIINRLLAEMKYFGEYAPQRHLFKEYDIMERTQLND